MKQVIKDIAKILKRLAYSSFLIMFFVLGFQLGIMFEQHHLETGDTFKEWLNYEKECEVTNKDLVLQYDFYNNTQLQDNKDVSFLYSCEDRIKDIATLVGYLRLSILFVFLVSLFDYFANTKEHFITRLRGLIKS